jgi:uncharacterized repeat protein (TIGR01451 family)
LTIGLAVAVALSMAFASGAEARGHGHKHKHNKGPTSSPPTCQSFPGIVGQACMSKTANPTTVKTGQQLTFTVTESNFTNVNSPDAIVDNLPPNVQFVSASQNPGGTCTNNAGTVTCPLANLLSGGKLVATIVVTPTQTGTFTNNAHNFFNNLSTSANFKVTNKKRHR